MSNNDRRIDPKAKALMKSLVKDSKKRERTIPAFIEMSDGSFRKNPLLED